MKKAGAWGRREQKQLKMEVQQGERGDDGNAHRE